MFKIIYSASKKMNWGWSFTARTAEDATELANEYADAGWYVNVMPIEMFTERYAERFPDETYQ